jgi:hypothetical protein
MKEKDLFIDFKPQQAVYFVEKDDQSYGPIVSGSQLTSQYLDFFYEKKQRLEFRLRQELIENKISPVHYYMSLQDLSPSDLALRAKVSRKMLKKHLTSEGFKLARISHLKEYARVFNVQLVNFFQILQLKKDDQNKIAVEQLSTDNDLLILTNIESR